MKSIINYKRASILILFVVIFGILFINFSYSIPTSGYVDTVDYSSSLSIYDRKSIEYYKTKNTVGLGFLTVTSLALVFGYIIKIRKDK